MVWVPTSGLIVKLNREIEMVRDCPYLSFVLKDVQPRYTVLSVIVDTSEFYTDEVVEELEQERETTFDQELNYNLQQSLEELHQTVVRRLLGIIGHDKNIPVFEKWVSQDTAFFLTREARFQKEGYTPRKANAEVGRLGRHRRLQFPYAPIARVPRQTDPAFSFR